MKLSKHSAPGKIILAGEHAVVYGQPAIAVPVLDLRTEASVVPEASGRQRVVSPETGLDVWLDECLPGFWAAEVIRVVRQELGLSEIPPFRMDIRSSIPVAAGMGSGAAVAVAAIRALADFLDQPLNDARVNALSFEIEKVHHGTPSGIDNTVVTYAAPVFFIRDQLIERLHAAEPITILVADTGVPSPTALAVGDVRRSREQDPPRYNAIFETIGELVREARAAIETADLKALGEALDENHRWLYEIGVSSRELEHLVNAARDAGALGAKLSGGGRGGNMVALVEPDSAARIEDALQAAGASRTMRTVFGGQNAA